MYPDALAVHSPEAIASNAVLHPLQHTIHWLCSQHLQCPVRLTLCWQHCCPQQHTDTHAGPHLFWQHTAEQEGLYRERPTMLPVQSTVIQPV